MHPAFSVIIFTSLSGAGYGSLAILAAVKYFDFFALNPLYGFFHLRYRFSSLQLG